MREEYTIRSFTFLDLNGTWRMKRSDEDAWLKATVPGSVYSDLMANGKMADPFYRDNEEEALALMSYDWVYEREFSVSADFLNHDRLFLVCEGLDTLAEIRLNGKLLAATSNMHRRYEFAVKNFLKAGRNVINILFRSPVNYITGKNKEDPLWNAQDAVAGISHLRKAHCMFGWDWGPKLPDAGIWRSIALRAYDQARINAVRSSQTHQPGNVTLTVDVQTEAWNVQPPDWEVTLTTPQGEKLVVPASTGKPAGAQHRFIIDIRQPELWWPHGQGPQPLYTLSVELKAAGTLLDSRVLNIGMRMIRVRREPDPWGESFAFEINGRPVFIKGANYIPEDNILARCNPERTEKLIQACLAAHFNGIRVWGGGYYPPDYFYDLCDRYGLLVWQDFMFACAVYRLSEDFAANIRQEALDNVRRLRHHASLALWCGNNEMEVGMTDWNLPHLTPQLKQDYLKQYEQILADVVKKEDPETTYWPSSPSSGGNFDNPNDYNRGDVHYWEVWHGLKPFTEYRKYFFRFASEFGFQSFPCLRTVKAFTLPEDRNIFSYIMEKHQKNGQGNGRILHYLADNYLLPGDFPSLLYLSQLLQAEAIKYGVEHWRQNRGRCMGAFYWQLNDCWPVTSWSSIDYFGRWKALHYFAKKFYAPVLLSACETGSKVELYVTNDTGEVFDGEIRWSLRENNGRIIQQSTSRVKVQPQSALCCTQLDFGSVLCTQAALQTTYLEYSLLSAGGLISSGTALFTRVKYFKWLEPQLSVEITETERAFAFDFQTKHFARNIELTLTSLDGVFSDNYFDLSPGTVYRVTLPEAGLPAGVSVSQLQKQLVIRSMYDAAMRG